MQKCESKTPSSVLEWLSRYPAKSLPRPDTWLTKKEKLKNNHSKF